MAEKDSNSDLVQITITSNYFTEIWISIGKWFKARLVGLEEKEQARTFILWHVWGAWYKLSKWATHVRDQHY